MAFISLDALKESMPVTVRAPFADGPQRADMHPSNLAPEMQPAPSAKHLICRKNGIQGVH